MDNKIIKLTSKTFLEQISLFGYFAEMIPDSFTTKLFSKHIKELSLLVSCNANAAKASKKHTTAPIEISTYKNEVSRRIISVPNPESFLRLSKLLSENWDTVTYLAKSENSLSPITIITDYCGFKEEELNSANVKDAMRIKSDFVDGIKKCIKTALGYQYQLNVDIANCYNTIYTHSVTWAICGKQNAKLYMKTKQPIALKDRYEFGDKIDAFIRFQKNNETNGIVVGPYTSRIVSEIILSELDRQLRNEGFSFQRYVDDYKFYFRSRSEAEEAIKTIEKLLNEYNLNLNLSKTEIIKYPFNIISNMKKEYDREFIEEGIFGVLNRAAAFYVEGEKGAFKYALKYIKRKELQKESIDTILPLLINIMLLDPKYGNYVISFLQEKREDINDEQITIIANKELDNSLRQGLQQESLLFMHMIKTLNIEIQGANLLNVLRSENDFAVIMALDLWKNHNEKVIRNKTEAANINNAIKDLGMALEKETFNGNRWILLYEVEKHNLIPRAAYTPIPKPPFFQAMANNDITFYRI